MSDLAPLLQGFFTDKLMRQRQASPHTIAAYRDTFKLLLGFCARQLRRPPARLGLADLDATTISAFLQHLETVRANTASTRNARLAADHRPRPDHLDRTTRPRPVAGRRPHRPTRQRTDRADHRRRSPRPRRPPALPRQGPQGPVH